MNIKTSRNTRVFVSGLLIVFGLAQLGHAQTQPLTLEEIVSLKRVSNALMSPDGDRIAYLLSVPRTLYVDDDGKPYRELHVVDLDGGSHPFVTGKIEIASAAWSADGKAIYYVAKNDSEEEQ